MPPPPPQWGPTPCGALRILLLCCRANLNLNLNLDLDLNLNFEPSFDLHSAHALPPPRPLDLLALLRPLHLLALLRPLHLLLLQGLELLEEFTLTL